MRHLGASRVLLLAVVAATAGCRSDRAEWRAALEAQNAARLTGLWLVELHRDASVSVRLSARTTTGEIALTLNEGRVSVPGIGEPPVYFGTYDIDFEAVGVATGLRKGVPALAGILAGGDSLMLRLIDDSPRDIELRGRITGDSVMGRWRAHDPRGIDAAGDFVLRRR
jgi:hypothetical protein